MFQSTTFRVEERTTVAHLNARTTAARVACVNALRLYKIGLSPTVPSPFPRIVSGEKPQFRLIFYGVDHFFPVALPPGPPVPISYAMPPHFSPPVRIARPAPVIANRIFDEQGNNTNHRLSSRSSMSAMKIHRLPEELAPPPPGQHENVGNAEERTEAAAEAATAGYIAGIRLPAPANHRLSHGGTSVLPGVEMEIDRPCTLLVCFHDEMATKAAAAGLGGGGGASDGERRTSQRRSSVDGGAAAAASSNQPLPQWATNLGLRKTRMKVSGRGQRCRRGQRCLFLLRENIICASMLV